MGLRGRAAKVGWAAKADQLALRGAPPQVKLPACWLVSCAAARLPALLRPGIKGCPHTLLGACLGACS